MSFFPDITPLTKEIQEFKNNQQVNQAQIIALLEEQNKLLKEILSSIGSDFNKSQQILTK
jgi:hypothetical protein